MGTLKDLIEYASVAQSVEHRPFKAGVQGSSPCGGTKTNRQLTQVDWRFVLVFFSFHSSVFTFLLASVNCLFERGNKREERREVVKSNSYELNLMLKMRYDKM